MTEKQMSSFPRLGVNIDHVATLRQLRATPYPSLIEAADACRRGGANQITIHLREDRRHIQDRDLAELSVHLIEQAEEVHSMKLNLEMAATPEMLSKALKHRPHWVCFVPEKRHEVTTEGGLDLRKSGKKIARMIKTLKDKKIHCSLFVEPSTTAMKMAAEMGADAVEIHTGRYCRLSQSSKATDRNKVAKELLRIQSAGELAQKLKLAVHAGHGIDLQNVRPLVELRQTSGTAELISEYNIGHFLVCRATMLGLERAVREMTSAIRAP